MTDAESPARDERGELGRQLERCVYQLDEHEKREHADAARIAALESEVERLTRERDAWECYAKHARAEAKSLWDQGMRHVGEAVVARQRAETAERERDEARERVELQASVIDQCETALEFERTRLARARADALEDAARVAEAQPYYYDIHRQWVKDEIARKVRALIDSEPASRAALAAEKE